MKVKVKVHVAFKRKQLLTPCKRLLKKIFKFRFKKPLSIRPLHSRQNIETKTNPFTRLLKFLPCFSVRKSSDMDRLMELKSFSEAPFPSPLTPAYVRMGGNKEVSGQKEVEDACRSFENYLVEMVVEEKKTKDLMDVEELLYCWKNLKCPVFRNLVCRFYGELCKDLFSNTDQEDADSLV